MDYRFYLQALGITGLFVVLLILIWVASGGPASEAAVRNANHTRTAIAMTGSYLLQPRTRTPAPFTPTSVVPTNIPASTSASLPVASPTNTSLLPQLNSPVPSIGPSSTPFPTETPLAEVPLFTITAPPGQLGTKAPPVLPSETPVVTVISAQDPADFAAWYFTRVWNERDYQNLWDHYLTPSFKTNVGSGLFEDYVGWWNLVERIDVNSVYVLENNGRDAWVRVDLTFHMKDGRVVRNQIYDYDFLYDASRETWMFDSSG